MSSADGTWPEMLVPPFLPVAVMGAALATSFISAVGQRQVPPFLPVTVLDADDLATSISAVGHRVQVRVSVRHPWS